MGYFVQGSDGQTKGPFGAADIVQSIQEGRLPPNVSVRDELRGDWAPASAHREISDLQFGAVLSRSGVDLVDRADFGIPPVEGTAIGRLAYFGANVGISALAYAFIFAYAAASTPSPDEFGYTRHADVQGAALVLALLFVPVRLWVGAMRCRDLGNPGSDAFKLLIPFYNIYFGLVLLFSPGRAALRD